MEELYTLAREVGRGSYGVVFEGHMAKTGQRVAIKRLPCISPECIELYLQELWVMRATAKNNPNVIALHDCLLQTGSRTLEPLRSGRLPLDLVESALKGIVVCTESQTGQEDRTRSDTHLSRRKKNRTDLGGLFGSRTKSRLRTKSESDVFRCERQEITNSGLSRSKINERTHSEISKTPMRTNSGLSRLRKRPEAGLQGEEENRVPRRCCALWLVMEYCDGGDLNHYLLSRPPDSQRNNSVVQQLSSAIAFLHRLRIVHRDLKPDNVLVSLAPSGPLVKVADFGLSKMCVVGGLGARGDDSLTRQHFSSTCGSDFYMAPEVWGGLSYTAQADIFSLGVMFWAVLERITFLEEGSTEEQLGAYVCRGRWLMPLGEALWENPDLQVSVPMKARRAPPLPPPPGQALCTLLLDMLASDPDARPTAAQLECRVRVAMEEDAAQ
ncbi:serine/threonine-protein kinase pdik1l [Esox lucius]|uniref:Protein kinase domain-containing protein n=1 Tax=Esox lucius TaxID=8010 RepID=A0AAY5L639_ESOLU|nr:serine/threonine-protein kinase pdik1l [Esox lucius]XP_019912005.2 serine/threonine-protein kinase pdik1l [Esox lucius]XP_034143627.1 serine/threonine-protein kinase pdik1l [Esox lucius]